MRGEKSSIRSGFSLLEVLISLAIISIALLALLSVLTGGMKAQSKTSRHAQAHAVAEQTFERMSALLAADPTGYDDFWSGGSWNLPPEQAQVTIDGVRFHAFVSSRGITNQQTKLPLGSKQSDLQMARLVALTVAWSEDSSRSGVGDQQIAVSRIFSRRQR